MGGGGGGLRARLPSESKVFVLKGKAKKSRDTGEAGWLEAFLRFFNKRLRSDQMCPQCRSLLNPVASQSLSVSVRMSDGNMFSHTQDIEESLKEILSSKGSIRRNRKTEKQMNVIIQSKEKFSITDLIFWPLSFPSGWNQFQGLQARSIFSRRTEDKTPETLTLICSK